jgi:hypothetical protein
MSFDLTGQFISDTYGRVVQYVSGALYDGFGNLVEITGSIPTGSNTFFGNQTISGSLIVTGSVSLPSLTPYSLVYLNASYNLTSLPSPITSSGDTIAIFVSESNSWTMSHIIDGGSF